LFPAFSLTDLQDEDVFAEELATARSAEIGAIFVYRIDQK
jgi:hypothetical protein